MAPMGILHILNVASDGSAPSDPLTANAIQLPDQAEKLDEAKHRCISLLVEQRKRPHPDP